MDDQLATMSNAGRIFAGLGTVRPLTLGQMGVIYRQAIAMPYDQIREMNFTPTERTALFVETKRSQSMFSPLKVIQDYLSTPDGLAVALLGSLLKDDPNLTTEQVKERVPYYKAEDLLAALLDGSVKQEVESETKTEETDQGK